MKQFLLLLIFVCFPAFALLIAQIPNAGFESWNEFDLWEEPDVYITSNAQAALTSGFPNVVKVDGVTGNAAHIETVGSFIGVTPGLIGLLSGDNGLSGGVPYTSIPDSIAMYLRYNIMPEDSATLFVSFQEQGFPLSIVVAEFTGQQDEFKRFAFDIPPFFSDPDTVLFALLSSDSANPVIGSYIEVDDVTMIGVAEQLPNNQFEDWTQLTFEEPDEWTSLNFFNTFLGGEPSAGRTTDAFEGNFALRLESVELLSLFGDVLDTAGVVITSSGSLDDEFGGFAYSGQPDLLSGYYKYEPVGSDSAGVFLQFSRWDPVLEARNVLFEDVLILPPANNYTRFEVPVVLNETPDTALIGFSSSNPDTLATPGLGSKFYVDALSFEVNSSVAEKAIFGHLELSPNPTTERLRILIPDTTTPHATVAIFNSSGVMVVSKQITTVENGLVDLSVKHLPSGNYIVALRTSKDLFTERFIKQ